ncbi:PIR protein [Plasmodium ovale]|uniref:PIR protein n=1 Tax=Plasmodium ovale TaxID=36330 RepID=A0A1C3KKK5_PLAOA|nr:PIR protein [Plasmodium ovale]
MAAVYKEEFDDILRTFPTYKKYEHLNEDVTVNDFDNYCREIFTLAGNDSEISILCKKLARNYKRITQTKNEERGDTCVYFKYWLYDEIRKLSKSDVYKKYLSGINNNFQKSPGINSQSYHEYISYINDLYKKHIDENDCCTVWEDCTHYFDCDDDAVPEKLLAKINLPRENSKGGTQAQDSRNIISRTDSSYPPLENIPQEIDKTLEGGSLEALKTRGPAIGARGGNDSHVKDMNTGLQNVNDPPTAEYEYGILPASTVDIFTTIEEKPYILQNKYARIAYAMTLTMARTPLKFSFLKKIFKRKRDKNKLRRKYENETISYDLEDVYINSYNIPFHLRYYQA